MLTKSEIKEIKKEHSTAEIKYISSYGKEIDFNEKLCCLAAKYNSRKNELIFLVDARKM